LYYLLFKKNSSMAPIFFPPLETKNYFFSLHGQPNPFFLSSPARLHPFLLPFSPFRSKYTRSRTRKFPENPPFFSPLFGNAPPPPFPEGAFCSFISFLFNFLLLKIREMERPFWPVLLAPSPLRDFFLKSCQNAAQIRTSFFLFP